MKQSNIQNSGSKIYLTGFMGSGKSTVGPLVADRLGWGFLDLDAWIEERAGKPIPAVFAEKGEAHFRAMEAEVLRATTGGEHLVVALGGGALTDEDNLRLAKTNGAVVYLRAAPAELARRLKGTADERPLLQDEDGRPLSDEERHQRIRQLLDKRAPYYEQAHATVDTDAQSVDETAKAVIDALREVVA